MSAMASHITGVSIVCSIVGSGVDQRKHQSSASLAFVRGIHRWPVNSTHKRPVTQNRFHMMTSWLFQTTMSSPDCLLIPVRYNHNDVIQWKRFPHYWYFVMGIHRSPVGFPLQRPVIRTFGVSLMLAWKKKSNKHPNSWWSETLWRSCDITVIISSNAVSQVMQGQEAFECFPWLQVIFLHSIPLQNSNRKPTMKITPVILPSTEIKKNNS